MDIEFDNKIANLNLAWKQSAFTKNIVFSFIAIEERKKCLRIF